MDLSRFYDVIIVGGGPAGLTAGLYLSRAKYRVLVIEKDHFGGQITITSEVVNYPGVKKTSGKELTENMRQQAEAFGSEFLLAEVLELKLDEDIKVIKTSRGEFQAYGVLLATGARPRQIGFIGEKEFAGHGVAYCATCDGEFFTGKNVFVIGGGFAAAEESVFLTKFAKHVTVLVREDDFTCAKTVAEHTKNHEKIDVVYNVDVEEVKGENSINYIRYRSNKTNEVTEFISDESFGVFVFAGYVPETTLVRNIAEVNPQGYIITDSTQKTSVNGLYAAGDVCIKPLRQVVTAVGDGALAATELEKYVASMHNKIGIIPSKPVEKKVEEKVENKETKLFSKEIVNQLKTVFNKMENNLELKLYLDERSVSNELEEYVTELSSLTNKLSVIKEKGNNVEYPFVNIRKNNQDTGLAFHGVPGGHEFTSFVLGLYNASGNGQQIDSSLESKIKSIDKKIDMKVLVSLSCTMCPELVVAAQKIASLNDNISAHIYDLNHFGHLKEKYNVMSVPCLVVNDTDIYFGKKNIEELFNIINK